MQDFIEWIETLDMAQLTGWLVAFLTTYGASIVAIIVTLIKLAVSRFNYQKALGDIQVKLDAKQIACIEELKATVIASLDSLRDEVMAKEEADAKERMEAINQISASVDEAVADIQTNYTFDDLNDEVESQ